MISGTRARIAASNGGRSTPSIWARGASMSTPASSVFSLARPRPGKCFAVAATPLRSYAPTAAATDPPTAPGSPGYPRPASALPGSVTSATGARLMFTPMAFSARPAEPAAVRAAAGVASPGCGVSGGANFRIRISPPSWSVATSAPLRAARCSLPVSPRVPAASVTLPPKRITPAASSLRSQRRTHWGGSVPSNATITTWPTAFASGIAAAGTAGSPPVVAVGWPGSSPSPPAPAMTPTTSASTAIAASARRRRRTAGLTPG